VVDVINGLCLVFGHYVLEVAIGVELYAKLVDDICMMDGVLGLRSYYLLKTPFWMLSILFY